MLNLGRATEDPQIQHPGLRSLAAKVPPR